MNRRDAGTWSPPLSVWGGRHCEAFEHHPMGLPAATLLSRGEPIKGKTLRGSLKAARQPGFPTKPPTEPHLAAASWKYEQMLKKSPDIDAARASQ